MSHRTNLRVLLALASLALVYLSLYPFDFQRSAGTGGLLHWRSPSIDSDWVDMLANFAGYVPVGFLAMAAWDLGGVKGVILITSLGMLFSLGIELVQMYLTVRDSNLRDLTFNTLGTAAGSLTALSVRGPLSRVQLPWPPPQGWLPAGLWTSWQMYPFLKAISIFARSPGKHSFFFLWLC